MVAKGRRGAVHPSRPSRREIQFMSCSNEPDAAESAVRLRQRVRALAAGQTAAFDLLCYEFGGGSAIGATIGRSGDRLGRLAALLADVAWTLGDHGAAY